MLTHAVQCYSYVAEFDPDFLIRYVSKWNSKWTALLVRCIALVFQKLTTSDSLKSSMVLSEQCRGNIMTMYCVSEHSSDNQDGVKMPIVPKCTKEVGLVQHSTNKFSSGMKQQISSTPINHNCRG